MAAAQLVYYNDQELPSAVFDWTNAGEDFSTGWTFSVRLARTTARATTVLLKTTGITSTATTVTVAWSVTDWSGLEADTDGTSYYCYLYARRTSDSKDLEFRPGNPVRLDLYAAPGTSAVSPSSYPITVTAASVTYDPTGTPLVGTTVQAAITEHVNDTVAVHAASAISFTPTGTIAATNVQAAIAEVALEAGGAATPLGLMAAPTNAIAQTMARQHVQSATVGLTSTRQQFTLIYLPAGTINTISILSGSVGATSPTNQWFSLYDLSRNKLAVTADDTTTAWAADTVKTLTISGGYTVATAGYYYVGAMVAASIPPSFCGFTLASTALATLAPIMCARDNTNIGLSTPATAPATASFVPFTTGSFYAYVS